MPQPEPHLHQLVRYRRAGPWDRARTALSAWFMRTARPGLLLGVSTVTEDRLEAACAALREVAAL